MKLLLIFYSLHTSVCLEGITILLMKYLSCLWPYFSLFISTNSTKNRPLSLFVIHFPKKEKEKLSWGMGGVLEDQVFFLVELDDLDVSCFLLYMIIFDLCIIAQKPAMPDKLVDSFNSLSCSITCKSGRMICVF